MSEKQVYVIEAMKVNRRWKRRYLGEVIRMKSDEVHWIHNHIEWTATTIQRQTAVMIVRAGYSLPVWDGEFVSCRAMGDWEEVYESSVGTWILRNDEVISLDPDSYAFEILTGKHGDIQQDLSMFVYNSIFETLLERLTEDYERCHERPWPDLLSECIVDVLRSLDPLTISRSDFTGLETEILQLFNQRNASFSS